MCIILPDFLGFSFLQKAQSKKGKVAEKSPQEEQLPSGPLKGDATVLNQKIIDQGNVVRKLKGDKAPKVCDWICLLFVWFMVITVWAYPW